MPQENNVSLNIPEADKVEIKAAIQVLVVKLIPHLIALTASQRQKLPKAADKTLAFLEKIKDFMDSNPDLIPPFVDKAEYLIDLDATDELHEFFTPLNQIVSMLDDSMMLSASEAFVAGLAYYSNSKNAAKMNVPGAKEVYEELSKRFKGK